MTRTKNQCDWDAYYGNTTTQFSMTEKFRRLDKATEGCRVDMHEPDEQGISAIVTGYRLDNAMGADPMHNCGEFTVGIKRTIEDAAGETYKVEWFNLADLIALARLAEL